MSTQIALQLYTLRDFLKTPADIAATLKRVKQIGYNAVQVSGMGPIDPQELKKILDGEGLKCVVTHMSMERFKSETAKVIEEHQLWGCKYTAIGGFFKESNTVADWMSFINEFGPLCDTFAKAGVRLGYHNHSHEYIKVEGQIPMQLLLDKLPQSAWFEFDTYWVQHGGGDPAAWIDKVAGRIPVVHFKDMTVARRDGKVTHLMAEVGEGNLNWPRIIDACRRSKVEWFCIEQDVCQRDPFESVAISLKNLKTMGIA